MAAYVYLLRCGDGSLYCGWTNDFSARLAAHRAGKGAKYTRSHAPVEPVYLEECEDKSAALKREAAVKRLARAEKEKLVEAHRSQTEALLTQIDLN